jgi:hypothetical protein
MAYEPTVWKDRVVERPLTFNMVNNPDGTVTFVPAPGVIVESGTPVNAVNLNKLEQGLKTHEADEATEDALGHVRVDGRTVFVNDGIITLNPPSGVFYLEGWENEEITGGWVPGATAKIGVQSKESDHLYMEVTQDNAVSARTYVTNTLVDLSSIKNIFIDWEYIESHPKAYASLDIAEATQKMNYDYVATRKVESAFSRKIDVLDVSALNGTYHVRLTLYLLGEFAGVPSGKSKLKVYKVWGEK